MIKERREQMWVMQGPQREQQLKERYELEEKDF
jgi:hypothetical protein